MTNAPHLLNGSRTGIKYGSTEMLDHMAWDGLTNPDDGKAMGVFGDAACAKYDFSREDVDAYSTERANRAKQAIPDGSDRNENVQETIKTRKDDVVHDTHEQPGRTDAAKTPTLPQALGKDGTRTATTSSPISTGPPTPDPLSADPA